MSLWYSFCIILVNEQTQYSDIVLFCLNPLKSSKKKFYFWLTCNYHTKHQIAIVICIDSASVGIVPPLYGIMQFRPKTALAPASANVKGNRSTLHTCQLSRLRLDSPDFTTWKKPFPLSWSGKQKHYKIPILKKSNPIMTTNPRFSTKI